VSQDGEIREGEWESCGSLLFQKQETGENEGNSENGKGQDSSNLSTAPVRRR